MIDQFYTPEAIASHLYTGVKKMSVIADFAIGDGALIKNLPFKPQNVIGLDIDSKVISQLKYSQTKWDLMTGDFLNPNDNVRLWLDQYLGRIDLIVLNPPFSCKGKKRSNVKFKNEIKSCRIATAFLLEALKYLKPKGMLVAVLPLSIVKSEADLEILNQLTNEWNISLGEKFGPSAFKGCSPSSIILTILRRTEILSENKILEFQQRIKLHAQLVRGTISMPATSSVGKYKVLHTVNLRNGKIITPTRFTERKIKFVSGTFLCIPRVCKPSKEKIVIVYNEALVLSDCIFALSASNVNEIKEIKNLILSYWNEFAAMYESTCAPYITTTQLQLFLKRHGVSTTISLGFENGSLRKKLPSTELVFDSAVHC